MEDSIQTECLCEPCLEAMEDSDGVLRGDAAAGVSMLCLTDEPQGAD